jgi:murein DD-endopeptidase MepM/ murein hydrolase activator NlpD
MASPNLALALDPIWRRLLALLASFSLALLLAYPLAAQESAPGRLRQGAGSYAHVVAPGDTWLALSLRYGLDQEELQHRYGSINRQRQPIIGDTLLLDFAGERHGRLLRPLAGGLLAIATQEDISPWVLALAQNGPHPFAPVLHDPLLVAGGAEPPRELPLGWSSLSLSPSPAVPGRALAVHGVAEDSSIVSLSSSEDALPATQHHHLVTALGAFNAFTGFSAPELLIIPAGQPAWSMPWRVVDGDWTYEQFDFTGTAAAIDMEAILSERERLHELWSHATPRPLWRTPFRRPIEEFVEITSLFGARRSIGGGPYSSYHEGVDFSAYRATPVFAAGDGRVVLADELAVRGGAVIIDHGLGLFSGYYHLSEIAVTPGQIIRAGERLGGVGSTGRSTGNHLHWDLLAAGVNIDALAWLDQGLDTTLLNAWRAAELGNLGLR